MSAAAAPLFFGLGAVATFLFPRLGFAVLAGPVVLFWHSLFEGDPAPDPTAPRPRIPETHTSTTAAWLAVAFTLIGAIAGWRARKE